MNPSIIQLSQWKSFETYTMNAQSIPSIFHLKLPDNLVNINLISIIDLNDNSNNIPIFSLNKCGIWLDIESKNLDISIGYHKYKIQGYVDGDLIDLYFRYNIQTDNPSKPYIYMNRGK